MTVIKRETSPDTLESFDLVRGILSVVRDENSLEREITQDLRKARGGAGFDPLHGGNLIIPLIAGRANITAAGSNMAQPAAGPYFDSLLALAAVLPLATVLTSPGGKLTISKGTGATTAVWRAEDPGTDLTRTNLTASTVALAFKTVQAATAVSRQALFSAAGGGFGGRGYDLEGIIRNDLTRVLARGVDAGALTGAGTANQPLGLLTDTNIGTYVLAADAGNGGAVALADLTGLELTIADAGGFTEASRKAVVTSNAARKKLRMTERFSGNGGALWTDDDQVVAFAGRASAQVPRNLTKGTATTVCSAMLFGAFEQLVVAVFGGGIDVVVDPYTLALQNMIDISASLYVDCAAVQPAAFQKVLGALTT